MMKLSTSDIENLIENKLLFAIQNFYDYKSSIKNFILNDTTKDNIVSALKKIDFSQYAWQAESLSQLIEIYDYFKKGNSLIDIINKFESIKTNNHLF